MVPGLRYALASEYLGSLPLSVATGFAVRYFEHTELSYRFGNFYVRRGSIGSVSIDFLCGSIDTDPIDPVVVCAF